MIPQIDNEFNIKTDTEVVLPSKTYKIHKSINSIKIDEQIIKVEEDRIIGYVDDIDAIRQTIYHILNVERYSCLIYDENYGVELEQYIGQGLAFIESTIQNTLTEALTQDDRITGVNVTEIEQTGPDIVLVKFLVNTNVGDIEMEVEIND